MTVCDRWVYVRSRPLQHTSRGGRFRPDKGPDMLAVVVRVGAGAPGPDGRRGGAGDLVHRRASRTAGSRTHRLLPRLQVPVLAGSLAVALGMGVFLSPPASVNAFGTLGRAEAAATPAAPLAPQMVQGPAQAGMAFPGVEGVDLLALGYQGVDLDAVTVAALDRPLPELPTERATELRSRIVVATAHVEGLRGAEYVLYENARSMRGDVRRAGAALGGAAEVLAESGRHLADVRARYEHQESLAPAQRALLLDEAIPAAVLHAAELDVLAAAEAHAATEAEVAAQRVAAWRTAPPWMWRTAPRTAWTRDIGYLYDELHAARARMLPAGRWLADVERGRTDLPLVTVEGFRVHSAIAGSLRDLLAAAAEDGIEPGARRTARRAARSSCGAPTAARPPTTSTRSRAARAPHPRPSPTGRCTRPDSPSTSATATRASPAGAHPPSAGWPPTPPPTGSSTSPASHGTGASPQPDVARTDAEHPSTNRGRSATESRLYDARMTGSTSTGPTATPIAFVEGHLANVKYNADGLVPAIVQEDGTGQILMMAWMNDESLRKTPGDGPHLVLEPVAARSTGARARRRATASTSGRPTTTATATRCCSSSSRRAAGACHTGEYSCFYRSFADPDVAPTVDASPRSAVPGGVPPPRRRPHRRARCGASCSPTWSPRSPRSPGWSATSPASCSSRSSTASAGAGGPSSAATPSPRSPARTACSPSRVTLHRRTSPPTRASSRRSRRCSPTYRSPHLDELPPLHGGLVGYLGYDVVREVERLPDIPADDRGHPDAVLSVIGQLAAFDHWRQRVTLIDNVLVDAGADDGRARRRLRRRHRAAGPARRRRRPPARRAAASSPPAPRRRAARGHVVDGPRASTRPRSRWPGSTSSPATSSRSCCPSASTSTSRPSPSTSTGPCARSTRARTCTSSAVPEVTLVGSSPGADGAAARRRGSSPGPSPAPAGGAAPTRHDRRLAAELRRAPQGGRRAHHAGRPGPQRRGPRGHVRHRARSTS